MTCFARTSASTITAVACHVGILLFDGCKCHCYCGLIVALLLPPLRHTLPSRLPPSNVIRTCRPNAAGFDVVTLLEHGSFPSVVQNFNEGWGLACPTQVDQQVVIPLPMEDQWCDATSANNDLKLVMQALQSGNLAAKADFQDKGYAGPCKEGQLEVGKGLVYWHKGTHNRRLSRFQTCSQPKR